MIPVEEIRPGYTIALRKLGPRVVSRVDEFEDGTFVVVYFQHGEQSFESSKGGGYGARNHHRLVEHSLRPHRPGELVDAEPGSGIRAEQLREQLERDLAQRLEAWIDRSAA